jgi:hypothetical protein
MFHIGLDSVSNYNEESLTFGYYSFKPIFDMFGGTKVFPPGYYLDSYNYHDYITTNLFTYYRALIQDFGLLGSCFFIFFIGIGIHYSYYILLTKKRPYFSVVIFIVFCTFLGLSYILNIFTARNIFLVALGLYTLLFFNSLSSNFKIKNRFIF